MSSNERFVTLDGMRGVAALLVAGSHVGELLGIPWPPHAHLAVDFFFVLSGFVIAHAYEPRLGRSITPMQFIWLRIVRLHPLLLLASGITLAIIAARSGADLGFGKLVWTAAAGILLVPINPMANGAAFPLDGPAWTLFAEYAVNILFAFTAAWLSPRRLRGALVLGLAMLVTLVAANGGVGDPWRTDTILLALVRVVYPFFAGVCLSRLYRQAGVRLPSISPTVSVLALVGILLAPSTPADGAFELAAITVAFPLLVIASTRDQLSGAQVRLMSLSGGLSYPIYVLHFPLALLLVPVAGAAFAPVPAVALVTLCVVAVSFVALRYFDEPLRASLRSRVRAREVRALPA